MKRLSKTGWNWVAFGLVSVTDGTLAGSHLVFNPYVFEGDAVDAFKTLEALNPTERQQAQDIANHVYTSPGVPLPKGTDPKMVKVLIKVGVIDNGTPGDVYTWFAISCACW